MKRLTDKAVVDSPATKEDLQRATNRMTRWITFMIVLMVLAVLSGTYLWVKYFRS